MTNIKEEAHVKARIFKKLHEDKEKSLRELLSNGNEQNIVTATSSSSSSSSDSAARKACISREKYIASRQEFLRSYKLTKNEEGTLGRKKKKWFVMDNYKSKNPIISSILLCGGKLDVRDYDE